MLTVTTNDGEVFTGADEQEIVRAMRNTQWGAPERKRDWMVEVGDRVFQMTGRVVPTRRGARAFLIGLHRAGVVRVTGGEQN